MDIPSEDLALLMIVAGPAGSGKSTLCERLVNENQEVERLVTCTTRPPREGEKHGVDYFFLSNEEFDERIAADGFLEWAKVHTNRYGTPKDLIKEKLQKHIDLVMNIDVQGVNSIRESANHDDLIGRRLVTVFILPTDFDQIRERLRGRGKDDEAEIERRLITAKTEIQLWDQFDYVIQSGTREDDYDAIRSIWQAEKRRTKRLTRAMKNYI